jgi:hypothetical protein
MTSASNALVIKTYLVHPKEWKLGLLLLLIVGYARLFHLTSAGQSHGNALFDDSYAESHVQHMVTNEYCIADLHILCGDPRKPRRCARMYGDSLSRFWGIEGFDKEPNLECSLATKFARLERLHPVDVSKYPQLKDCDDCDDRILFVRVVWYSVFLMWQETERNFQMAKFPEIPSQQSMEERERMIRFLCDSMLDIFSSDAAYHAGIFPTVKEPWTRKEVLSFMRIAVELAQNTPFKTILDENGYFGYHIPTIALVLNKLVDIDEVEKEAGVEHFIPLHRTVKHMYRIFQDAITDECMYSHYDDGTLITRLCFQAMQTAPSRITEIRFEEGGSFIFCIHVLLCFMNFVGCFTLLFYFTSKQRFEKKMDAKKRVLEQELKDPILRQRLERKAQQLPEEHRQQFTIAKLEANVARWDSKAAALTALRRLVRRFRFMSIFFILITTMMCWWLSIFHDVSSMSRYLEQLFLFIAMLVASYAAPIGNSDEEGWPSEILMGTVDPSTTQALLSSNDQVPTSVA